MALVTPLWVDVSLWSADLCDLRSDIARMSSYADSFHLDVADGRFAPSLLFFPDLVAAIRRETRLPLHVHLMVEEPRAWAGTFIEAGADAVTVHGEALGAEEAIAEIREAGRRPGVALRVETPVELVLRFADAVDSVLLLGTEIGVKGCGLAPEACRRIRALAPLLAARRPDIRVIADGGIRTETVPLLRAAGADSVVPGSLAFGASDAAGVFRWLKSL
ncbi:MAG: ribulose-phosphate 3-epimerase [Bryobacteraceae bacterium]|nr:ribulose-phosphate 3-epimerase [Bryobacteraceae bacterium]